MAREYIADVFKGVTQKFGAAGITVDLLCYNISAGMSDPEIEYGFQMARARLESEASPHPRRSVWRQCKNTAEPDRSSSD